MLFSISLFLQLLGFVLLGFFFATSLDALLPLSGS